MCRRCFHWKGLDAYIATSERSVHLLGFLPQRLRAELRLAHRPYHGDGPEKAGYAEITERFVEHRGESHGFPAVPIDVVFIEARRDPGIVIWDVPPLFSLERFGRLY
jgi:hypothetical protein